MLLLPDIEQHGNQNCNQNLPTNKTQDQMLSQVNSLKVYSEKSQHLSF